MNYIVIHSQIPNVEGWEWTGNSIPHFIMDVITNYTTRNEVRGGILDSPCPSVRLSVCLLTFRVRLVASIVQDGFFPCLVHMINSMRGCVACDGPWPLPISSRSFGLDLQNCVCSEASTVLDEFFPYLVQMINGMRGCVACDDPWPWPMSSRSFGLDLENCVRSVASTVLDGFFLYLAQIITNIRGCVACYSFSESGNWNFWQIFEIFWPWPWKKILQFSMDSFNI